MKQNIFVIFIFMLYINNDVYSVDQNITIIGIGRLGLCIALCLEKAGFNVLGVDIDSNYIKKINNKSFESFEPFVSDYLKKSKNFKATAILEEGLYFSNIYFICVDTPTTLGDMAYDDKNLNKILSDINAKRVENKHIIISCTVFPGYISSIGKPLLKDCKNTTLNYNPEFIAQGNIIKDFINPSIVLIGQESWEVGNIIESIYKKVVENNPVFCHMTPISAEITKLALNCFVTTKIAFANVIADVACSVGADKYDILFAIGHDNRIGDKCLNPGYGYGGPCFPRDNRALSSYAQKVGIDLLISKATDASNNQHAQFMVDSFLKDSKSEYIFEDVTYKSNCPVPIIEESQKLVVAAKLAKAGKPVIIKDKKSVIDLVKKDYGNLFEYIIVS